MGSGGAVGLLGVSLVGERLQHHGTVLLAFELIDLEFGGLQPLFTLGKQFGTVLEL
jgi:hypothetical protein